MISSPTALRRVTVLGSTGSIGVNTLDVVSRHPERFQVFALTACRQTEALLRQCLIHRPAVAVVGDADGADWLRTRLAEAGLTTEILWGPEALVDVARAAETDIVMAAIVGAAGLPSALAAARAGKQVLLANKEALVVSGQLFMDAVVMGGARLLPIDSEHNAVFQALPGNYGRLPDQAGVRRILLTASGGPFRRRSLHELEAVTPEEACAHPNWVMGRKISVDSATMMNKGLEVIEAHWLFGASADRIQVVVHPQSVIHSMVEYADGSVLAQLGNPDMRTPIAYGLAYPDRVASGVAPLDLCAVGQLNFEAPDFVRFPCLSLAYDALREGGSAPALLNAANEVAVAAFLNHQIPYLAIPNVIRRVLERAERTTVSSLEGVLEADAIGRRWALSLLN
ncbi:MAG: 1-deoxy-D-xylulose-5-phosphate reductoisomerase [Zoogloeaceae bacterium]|nr:1-deoxy-D-xylulose-5-phosphate reductoisomerase [Zoogloeaceae bacterium]